ncbi:Phage tail fiber assembly protein [Collimonas arenae]|uniref:Phage tail fiber assembly protein n=1 Tax=Collimonas arenae TaxID=279058 RepID=A0A0A1FEP8_9BURK|nr:tail assembly chaperone [Collimonas arenae]AIY42996.1 Phage tail fiber assembly protein [Collimonas arenae]
MTKMIYNFSQSTGELLSTSQADISPLDHEVVYLIPAHATDSKPPQAGSQEIAVFAEGRWKLCPDWRGVALYHTVDGSPLDIPHIGDTPDGIQATALPRPSQDHVWNNGQWQFDLDRQTARLMLEAMAQRDTLLVLATTKMAPLQDAIDLDEATKAEAALLKRWKQYRVILNRIDTQDGFPAAIAWPVSPAA